MPQKDARTIDKTGGPEYITPQYTIQATLQYKTFLKRMIVEALQDAFKLYSDKTLKKCKIGLNKQTDRADFPAIVVKFYEQTIRNSGVAHREYGPVEESLNAKGKITAESGEITGLASTKPFIVGRTTLTGEDIPEEAYVIKIINGTSILINKNATASKSSANLKFLGTITERYIEYHHSLYKGDISLEVYGLSAVDRDKVADALMEVIGMGTVGPTGISFQERLYDFIGKSPYSDWHFVTVNTDLISGYGEQENIAPWIPEDVYVYQTEYRVPVLGEFYSITPKDSPGTLALIQEVDIYPWSTAGAAAPGERQPGEIPPEEYPDEEVPEEDYIKVIKRVDDYADIEP